MKHASECELCYLLLILMLGSSHVQMNAFHFVFLYGPEPWKRLEFCCRLFSQVNAKTLTEVGDPSTAICDAVEKLNINLLVLGERGLGKLKRLASSFNLKFDAMLMCLTMKQNIHTNK